MADTLTPPHAGGDGPGAPGLTGRGGPARPDASMTLLREVMERPLDPGYAEAAARARTPTRRRMAVTALLAVVAGFVLAVAVVEVRIPRPDAARATERIREEIQRRSVTVKERSAANAALRADIAAAQAKALENSGGSALVAQAQQLGVVTGELPVRGGGLRFTVNDAPGSREEAVGADPRTDAETFAGTVLDSDLQIIVNGLWQAGAEAIAVNGQRLTSLSAIRSAGEAILVDFRPLAPPYVIDAAGDAAALQSRFAAGSAGAYVQSVRNNNGIEVNIAVRDSLTLPGAGQLVLRAARPAPSARPTEPAASSSPTPRKVP